MAISRRSFVATLGASGAGVFVLPAVPMIAFRGREALYAFQGVEDRRADRRLASRPGMIRIDSNENPVGPGPRALEAIRNAFGTANRYPVLAEDDLVASIAKVQGVAADNVKLGCGSGELLRAAMHAFTAPDRALVSPNPTFEAPAEFTKFLGNPVTAVPVDAHLALDLGAMADAARGAGLVYLCNPNNPTATVHSKGDVTGFIDQVGRTSPQTTVLVDEAYFEYVDEPSYGTVMPLALENPRVIVMRTFSKVMGMAGLRVGYAIGRKETLAKLSSWVMGSSISQLSLAAAHAAVTDSEHVAREVRRNRTVRAYTRKFFADAGYDMSQGQANFVMVNIRRDAKAFKTDCIKRGVAVGRPFPPLNTYTRISFGTMPEMRKALQVFKTTLA
ncbi:MAG TPA: aminotransferase class I/II-fold pyridoxal phosphate-dependent enzyme [Gemmatimonadaceae bacterium]|nr:aminotransferase class I/II-fold pyridoxal phosphate-dependent enzyme [Gemmatimonadaceae bacterium]